MNHIISTKNLTVNLESLYPTQAGFKLLSSDPVQLEGKQSSFSVDNQAKTFNLLITDPSYANSYALYNFKSVFTNNVIDSNLSILVNFQSGSIGAENNPPYFLTEPKVP